MPANKIWAIRNEPKPKLARKPRRIAHVDKPGLQPALEPARALRQPGGKFLRAASQVGREIVSVR